MSKKYLAAVAAVLATTVIFSACGKQTIVDREGNTVEYMTNENNEILQNENGDIVVPKTDENGKTIKDKDGNVVTESLTFPEVLEVDGSFQNKYIKIETPKGWEQIGRLTTMIFKNEENGAQFTVQVREGKTPDDVESSWMQQFDQEQKSDLVKDYDIKKAEVEIGGKKILKLTRDYTLKEKNAEGKTGQSLCVYIVEAGNEALEYTGVISPENKGKVDFDKLVSEIIYK